MIQQEILTDLLLTYNALLSSHFAGHHVHW